MLLTVRNLTNQEVRFDGYVVPAPFGGQLLLTVTTAEFEGFTGLFAAAKAGLVSTNLSAAETTIQTLTAATQADTYDEPVTVGNKVTAHGTKVLPPVERGELSNFAVWSALPAGTGEMTIRIWRYRRLTQGSAFSFTQITDTFVYDSAIPFSFQFDLEDYIRPGLDLVVNDQLAVGRIYVPGGSPGLVNMLIKWAVTPLDGTSNEAEPPPDPPTWPPT